MKIKRTGICNTALHQSLAINNFTNQVKATCPCRHMGATALTATKLTQKSDFCLILARISRKSKSSKTGSSDQDFFWLQLLLRANIFFPNNSVSVYCLDNRLGEPQDKSVHGSSNSPPPYFKLLEGFPKFRPRYDVSNWGSTQPGVVQKSVFVIQPSNISRRYWTQRENPF